jgi:F0F1-type ATP synthase membrane subunit b/b'
LRVALDDMDQRLKEAKRAARLAPTLPEKLERQRDARTVESKRNDAWRAFDEASREIDRQKDTLLDDIGQRLEQNVDDEPLFIVRWNLT